MCPTPVSAADLRSTPGLHRQVSAPSAPVGQWRGRRKREGGEREGGAARDAPGGTACWATARERRGGGSSSGAHRPAEMAALSKVCLVIGPERRVAVARRPPLAAASGESASPQRLGRGGCRAGNRSQTRCAARPGRKDARTHGRLEAEVALSSRTGLSWKRRPLGQVSPQVPTERGSRLDEGGSGRRARIESGQMVAGTEGDYNFRQVAIRRVQPLPTWRSGPAAWSRPSSLSAGQSAEITGARPRLKRPGTSPGGSRVGGALSPVRDRLCRRECVGSATRAGAESFPGPAPGGWPPWCVPSPKVLGGSAPGTDYLSWRSLTREFQK